MYDTTQVAATTDPTRSRGLPAAQTWMAVYAVIAFSLFFDAVALAGLGESWERALLLLVGCVGIGLVRARPSVPTKATVVVVGALFGLLVCLRLLGLAAALNENRFPNVDIGQSTIAAVDAYSDGKNPYVEVLDPIGLQVDPEGSGLDFTGGYKYGPVMIWTYFPFVRTWDAAGLFALNWLALMGLVAAAAMWARTSTDLVGAMGAGALVLAPRFLDVELFVAGVTDLVPVALGIGGFAFMSRGRELPASLLVGLSIATKLVPGLIYAAGIVALAKRKPRVLTLMAATATAAHLPFLIAAPREMVANLALFNLRRPISGTSALFELPSGLAVAVGLVGSALALALPLLALRNSVRHDARIVSAVLMLAVAVLLVGSKTLNRNYFLWVLPLAATAVATRTWPDPPANGSPAGVTPDVRS